MPITRPCRRFIAAATGALTIAWGVAALAQDGGGGQRSSADTVDAMQKRILADPQMSGAVMSLRDNPQVQAILSDPALAAALSRGDLATLMADPKIKRLADDPAVRDLTRQVAP